MYFIRQFLPLVFLPMGIIMALLIAAAFTRRRSLLVSAIVLFWVSSTPLVGANLMSTIEGGLVRLQPADVQNADAIVVLSFGRVTAPGPHGVSEWLDADRFFGGIELFNSGKAPLLMFTGGWSPSAPSAPLEGAVLVEFARRMGLPQDRIVTTGRVATTEEEAAAVAGLLGAEGRRATVLLVTSAFHMARAQRLFEQVGLHVNPYPVDFSGAGRRRVSPRDLLPSPGDFALTHRALRELYGRAFYRLNPF